MDYRGIARGNVNAGAAGCRPAHSSTSFQASSPLATSLVLKRLPPRCSTGMLLEVLDAISARYNYVHVPLDHRTWKNMSMAFINFVDHEAACLAFQRLSRPSEFPAAFAPSTKAIWGEVHGLGPNLAHFLARYGLAALDPPYAPFVFIDGRCVPQARTVLRQYVDAEMLIEAKALLRRSGLLEPVESCSRSPSRQGDMRASMRSSRSETGTLSLSEIHAKLSEIPSYREGGLTVYVV